MSCKKKYDVMVILYKIILFIIDITILFDFIGFDISFIHLVN